MLLYFVRDGEAVEERLQRGKKEAQRINITIDQFVSRSKRGGSDFYSIKLKSETPHTREYILQNDVNNEKAPGNKPPINFFYSGPGGQHFLTALNMFTSTSNRTGVSMKLFREKDFEILVSTEILTGRDLNNVNPFGLVAIKYLPFGEFDQIKAAPLTDEFMYHLCGENPPRRVLSHCMPEFLSVRWPDDDQYGRLVFQLVHATKELLKAPKPGVARGQVSLFPSVFVDNLDERHRGKTEAHLGLEYLPE